MGIYCFLFRGDNALPPALIKEQVILDFVAAERPAVDKAKLDAEGRIVSARLIWVDCFDPTATARAAADKSGANASRKSATAHVGRTEAQTYLIGPFLTRAQACDTVTNP